MSWTATERFGARIAPGGLALAQDLVNTHATARGGMDLLADQVSAEAWGRSASRQWACARDQTAPVWAASAFGAAGLRALVETRAEVADLLTTAADERVAASGTELLVRAQVRVVSGADGRLSLVTTGTGVARLCSAVWSEIFLAQQNGTWPCLKLCREPGCRTAFYDTSRNSSGVWHDVNTCGNVHNLRASRRRRKAEYAGET